MRKILIALCSLGLAAAFQTPCTAGLRGSPRLQNNAHKFPLAMLSGFLYSSLFNALYITKSPQVPPHTHTTITTEPVNRRSVLSSALVGAALAIKFSAAPVSAAALSGEALKKAETVKESIKLLCSGGARSFTSSVFSPCSHYRPYSATVVCHRLTGSKMQLDQLELSL